MLEDHIRKGGLKNMAHIPIHLHLHNRRCSTRTLRQSQVTFPTSILLIVIGPGYGTQPKAGGSSPRGS